MLSVLSILTCTHPASDAFVMFSTEEIHRLDVAAVMHPGTLVAVKPADSSHSEYYNPSPLKTIEYGHCKGCDRSTRTVLIEFASATGNVERRVPYSRISGMEDTSRRSSILSHRAATKSATDMDGEKSSIGHLILTLRWSRHVTEDRSLFALASCVAERAVNLLSTELVLHDDLNKLGTLDEERKINAQLLDFFESVQSKEPPLVANESILKSAQVQLRKRLKDASSERDEEQKLWEQQNSGWDSTFWGGSHKREGRYGCLHSIFFLLY